MLLDTKHYDQCKNSFLIQQNSIVAMIDNHKIYSIKNPVPNKSLFFKLIIAVILCEGTGIISALIANVNTNSWFTNLNKPSWNPPSYLFAPVWTILYFLMAISLWLIWKHKAPETSKRNAYYLFAFQLFLNFWWSILFFKFHSPSIALVNIILMLAVIINTIIYFFRFSKTAAWLLIPYAAWVTFALFLNYSIYKLNN